MCANRLLRGLGMILQIKQYKGLIEKFVFLLKYLDKYPQGTTWYNWSPTVIISGILY